MKGRVALVLGLGLLGLTPTLALATETSNAVEAVAQSRMSTVAHINGRNKPVIYVGQFDGCDSVTVQNGDDHFDHYRVCGHEVRARNTVSPSWTESDGGKAVLKAVVSNAVLYGAASQTDANGYLITARSLGALQPICTNVEVIISYEGDLVDRALKSICSNPR